MKPGTYKMAPNETINDLVKKAGGYTNNAYHLALYTQMKMQNK